LQVLYKETFGANWDKSWAVGKSGDKELGKWELTAGDYYGGEEADAKGIMTSEDMRHYFLSTKFDAPISNKDSDIVVQYSIKYTKTPECAAFAFLSQYATNACLALNRRRSGHTTPTVPWLGLPSVVTDLLASHQVWRLVHQDAR
jgi:hypothetical protein